MKTVWTPRMLRYLARCASSGFSQRETAIWLGVTPAAVAIKAHQIELRFHGKPGRYRKLVAKMAAD